MGSRPERSREQVAGFLGAVLIVLEVIIKALDWIGRGQTVLTLNPLAHFLSTPYGLAGALICGFVLLTWATKLEQAREASEAPRIIIDLNRRQPPPINRSWFWLKLAGVLVVVYLIIIGVSVVIQHTRLSRQNQPTSGSQRDKLAQVSAAGQSALVPEPRTPNRSTLTSKPRTAAAVSPAVAPLAASQTSNSTPISNLSPPAKPPNDGSHKSAYSELREARSEVDLISGDWDFATLNIERGLSNFNKSDDPTVQADRDKFLLNVEQTSLRFDERWQKLEPQVKTAVGRALELMSRPGPKQLTPRQQSDERKNFAAANPTNHMASATEIRKGKVNRDEFAPLSRYLAYLEEKLSDYQENPTLP